MRRRRLRPQPRGVRGDAEQREGALPRAPAQRQPPLTEKPEPVLETARLVLRRFVDADRDTLARWNADAEYTRHLVGVQTRAESDAALDRWQAHWDEHGFGLLGVEWRETGELIGRTGPQYHRAWSHDPEIGWALDPEWWGRGIATEAGRASVAWAFGDLGFERVVSITTEENVASRRVMAKLGFTLLTRFDWERWNLWVHVLDPPGV